jgi:hypothetical protein
MEQEDVVNLAQYGAGSVPAGDSSANLPEGHNGSELMLRVTLEAAAAQIIPLPRPAGAETTAVVRTTVTQKLGRGL